MIFGILILFQRLQYALISSTNHLAGIALNNSGLIMKFFKMEFSIRKPLNWDCWMVRLPLLEGRWAVDLSVNQLISDHFRVQLFRNRS